MKTSNKPEDTTHGDTAYLYTAHKNETLISEHDLLHIGLSRHYVENIMNRVKEYKEIAREKMWERVRK